MPPQNDSSFEPLERLRRSIRRSNLFSSRSRNRESSGTTLDPIPLQDHPSETHKSLRRTLWIQLPFGVQFPNCESRSVFSVTPNSLSSHGTCFAPNCNCQSFTPFLVIRIVIANTPWNNHDRSNRYYATILSRNVSRQLGLSDRLGFTEPVSNHAIVSSTKCYRSFNPTRR